MTADRYAGAGEGWARGASLVYAPLARELVARSPHDLAGRRVLDLGAGTGVVSSALLDAGARPVGLDLSLDMLRWDARSRPPALVADVTALPLQESSIDDVVASFVLNHLTQPQLERALAELVRVTRPGGALLASVFANSSHSAARDAVDEVALTAGWQGPSWYLQLKAEATPLLGTAAAMRATALTAGLDVVAATEEAVDVGITEPEQLVEYRLGQAHFTTWLAGLAPASEVALRQRAVAAARALMRPYRPTVVFLAARTAGP